MDIKIKRALISVSDKTGIVEFAKELADMGVEILSTGGTHRLLEENSIEVKNISDFTGFPEMMDGRVKTLHPKVHGGLLCLRDNEEHVKTAEQNGIEMIDLVVVNLYPFEKTVANPDVDLADAIENIDIGGPTMLRSAAKNYRFVTVVTDPDDYACVLYELKNGGAVSLETRQRLCFKVFARTSAYDSAIEAFLSEKFMDETVIHQRFSGGEVLRYGENSHQQASAYVNNECAESSVLHAQVLHGKAMSYNNYVDADAALEAVKDLWDSPAVSIIKHTNPCGYATGKTLADAIERAWEGDPVSAYGSVIACTRKVDLATAQFLKGRFVEVLIAPGYDDDTLEFLSQKSKDIRLLDIEDFNGFAEKNMIRSITGGLLVQNRDTSVWDEIKCVTKTQFGQAKTDLAAFAFKACKHTKSNAIVIAREYADGCFQVMGMGAGQPNRIDSLQKLSYPRTLENLKIEFEKLGLEGDFEKYAAEQINQMVLASDAFFPFDDTVKSAAQIGIRYIIQPGGAKRDNESIAACDERDIAMAFTGMRHFKH